MSLEFTGGGVVDPGRSEVRAPGVDARPLPAWGLYARNVQALQLENVRLGVAKDDARPAMIVEHVGTIDLDALKLPRGADPPVVLNDVREVRSSTMSITLVPAKCLDLSVTAMPLAAIATVEGGDQEGLAQVELSVDAQTSAQWVWLKAHERKSVSFPKLSVSGTGTHRIQCGDVARDVPSGKD